MADWRISLAGAALALAAACLGAEEVASGPPVGGSTAPFSVQDASGPAKGSTLCYV